MRLLFNAILLHLSMVIVLVDSYDPYTESPHFRDLEQSATISPEIVNELKDFENLIPTTIVDAIVAKHYVIDGNFRTAFKYLRSNEFTHFQKQLLDVPEIIEVLDFLHMMVNATTRTETTAASASTLAGVKASSSSSWEPYEFNDNSMHEVSSNSVTTSPGTKATKAKTTKTHLESETVDVLAYERPQLNELEYSDDVRLGNSAGPASKDHHQPLVEIVLLDSQQSPDDHSNSVIGGYHNTQHGHRRHHRQDLSSNPHPLGSFTSFVAEIIGELPQPAYQHMITAKCKKNAKFADFYKALRSANFKPFIDEAMKTPNIQQIIKNLNSHDIDVKALEPIAFQVISWGPKVQ
ncbi:uncharacterized protein LOC142240242 [Haematobia irritans]|uniref:uncharacterized protein LOC142240242 n=1 Tax=Haematobia irritans TaxID=7368 RepID=UPI003F4FEAFC